MCFFVKQDVEVKKVANRYKVAMPSTLDYPKGNLAGFEYPKQPVLLGGDKEIKLAYWGLIPTWAKDPEIRKNTINARVETVGEKPSFKGSINKRCLVFVSGFYESKWLDEKGKEKEKYEITSAKEDFLVLAGIWNEWTDLDSGEIRLTYSILTTDAIGIMKEIHNHRERMPIMLNPGQEEEFLSNKMPLMHYAKNELSIDAQCLNPKE